MQEGYLIIRFSAMPGRVFDGAGWRRLELDVGGVGDDVDLVAQCPFGYP
jgi:hypothetical protein